MASCQQKPLSANTKSAAKEIETIGVELIERVKQCEDMTRDALAVIDEMKQTAGQAARYRTEAKRIFLEIEDCSLVTAEVPKGLQRTD